jgi:hypothetical protein
MNTEHPQLPDLSVRNCRVQLRDLFPGRSFHISDQLATGHDLDCKQLSVVTILGTPEHEDITATGTCLASCLNQLRQRTKTR